ncbi:MAG: patatin-like phospholipase family protein, partial [Calditrichia bacterium]
MKSLLIHCYGLILVILILQYVPQNTASCQETQVESSPKIGLVLSGGGARGFAHIGVLNILDSLNIPIAYVAGTSIGSIVGGLYAAGYSAHRIDSLVRSIDWPTVFSDLPSRSKLTYLEKQDMGRFQMTLRLNKLSPQPPSGLIYGQNISLLLSRFTLPQWEVTNFDSLPIPFRCVAADLITGREVVLRQGSLAKAIRASMSVPSIFSPVEWGDSLLVDGGVLNNCPVDVVREMGADYIIAVNVGTPKRSREELQNALSVLVQSFSLAGYQREEENLKQADLVLTPDLINYSSADFYKSKVEGMIREGEKVARIHLAQLKSLQRNSAPSVREISSMDLGNSLIYRIEITGNEKLNFSFIYQLLGLRPGQPMNISLLERRIEHLYSLGYFQTITYHVRQHGPNRYILRLSVKEKIQRVLRLGMRYQDDKKLIAGVNLKLNDFPFSGMRNEFTFLFSGLQLLEWETSLPRRIFGSRIYPYFYSYYQDIPIVIYSEREKIAGYHKRSFGTAPGIGLILKNWGVVKAEYNIEKLLGTPSIAFAEGITWPEWKYLVHTTRIYSVADFLDDPLDPRH